MGLPQAPAALLIALLPPRLLRHVEYVIGKDERVIVARTWAELDQMLHVHPVTVALIDPSADGASKTVEFERLAANYPSLPIIAYVPLTPSAFRAVAQLSKLGLEHVILYSHDDSAERMIATIDKVRANPLTERFIEELQPRLDQLPLGISKVVVEMFAEPHRYPNAQDMATNANVTIVRLYRAFSAADFAAPKKMVVAAKLLRAYTHLSDPGQSVGGASTKLSYRNPRIFAEHTNEVFGVNPSRLRARVTEDQLVETLFAFVGKETLQADTTIREKRRFGGR
jgi:AraC-like DNA-binding protein